MKSGDWLDERYRILRLLGEGGQGSVYLAVQERIYKFYAVKVMAREGESFSRESVELWKRLSHPGLPEIVDIVELEAEICLVMEYVEGKTLEMLIREGVKWNVQQVISWGVEICGILEYLHDQEPPIVFGDIKLSNLILRGNHIVMVDLGSAVLRSSKGKQSGTSAYLPGGEALCEANLQRDIFALGKCMEELLESRRISSELRKILKKCTSLEVSQQYDNIKQCRQELEKLQYRPWMLVVMVILALGIMAAAENVMEKEQLAQDVSVQYEKLLELASDSSMDQQRNLLENAVTINPADELGYLNLLENFLEDSVFSEAEEERLRGLMMQSDGEGICLEDRLGEQKSAYAAVAWKIAMAYWYFYDGEGGKNYATQWFEKLLQLPTEAVEEKKREQSRIYADIGGYRLALEHGDKTGESEVDFLRYWEDLNRLFMMTRDEMTQEEAVIRLYFWQEFLVQMTHYHLEFVQAGIEEKQLQERKNEIKQVVEQIADRNKVIRQKKKEIEEFLKMEWEEWK